MATSVHSRGEVKTTEPTADVVTEPPPPLIVAQQQEKTPGQQQGTGGGGVLDAVLLVIVKVVLAGVQGFVVVEWILKKVSEALVWVVELGMLLIQPPQ